ncbi:MAG: hypothetical protein M1819_003143 [Sarea resinae]|nr:MAG: hypothetical protein M1819_003143 [Sarea resinae]
MALNHGPPLVPLQHAQASHPMASMHYSEPPQPPPQYHTTVRRAPVYANTSNGTPINVSNGAVHTEARGVFVRNLSYEAGWREVKDLFRQAGNVQRCVIKEDPVTGKSRGCATVLFKTHADAKASIDMLDETEFMGRSIKVKYDQDTTMSVPPTEAATASEQRHPSPTSASVSSATASVAKQPVIVNGSTATRGSSAEMA